MLYFFIGVGVIFLILIFRKGSNAIINNGPGSLGESTRVIAKNYLFFRKPTNSGLPIDSTPPNFIIFELMYEFRQNLNQTVPNDGDLLQVLDFEKFNKNYPFFTWEKDFLPCFILKILYFESAEWRKSMHDLSSSIQIRLLEVIYNNTLEVVPEIGNEEELTKEYFIDLGLRCIDYWRTSVS